MIIRQFYDTDIAAMAQIWNAIVQAGDTFPQMQRLTKQRAHSFFSIQSFTGVADEEGEILGLYMLHPNNVGRCGHIANASYAVKAGCRGKGIGEMLVRHSMAEAKRIGFRILQFNAVVAGNTGAIRLYEKIGFHRLGTIPGGFYMPDGSYSDIYPFYIEL
jgi:ribosomal protein S18 acetylase RimI-like enzyme